MTAARRPAAGPVLVLAAALATAAAAAGVLLAAPGLSDDLQAGFLFSGMGNAAGAAGCAVAAVHARGRGRLVWSLLAAGNGVWAVTDVAYALTVASGVDVPRVSGFDAGWIATYGFTLTAVLLIYGPLRPERGWQGLVDGAAAAVAIALVAWLIVTGLGVPAEGDAQAVDLVYAIGDLTGVAALGWVVYRYGRRSPPWLVWATAAFGTQAVAGLLWIALTSRGHGGGAALVAYAAAGWLWVGAGLARLREPPLAGPIGPRSAPPMWSRMVPVAAALATTAAATAYGPSFVQALALAGVALTALRALGTMNVLRALDAERTARAAAEREAAAEGAVAEERARIARELHDSVGHAMSVITVQASVGAHLAARDPRRAVASLEVIEHTGRETLSEMRTMVGLLRQDATPPGPGLDRLDELVGDFRGAGMPVRLHRQGDLGAVPSGPALAAYRVVEESLTNVLRHAGQAPADVRVAREDGLLRVEVENGPGPGPVIPEDPPGTGGRGLAGMRERLALYGGEVDAAPRPGGGWRVAARVPLRAGADQPSA